MLGENSHMLWSKWMRFWCGAVTSDHRICVLRRFHGVQLPLFCKFLDACSTTHDNARKKHSAGTIKRPTVTIYSEQNVQEAGRKTGASHILDDDDEWLIPMRSKPSLRRLDSVLMLSGPAHSANGTMLCARTGLVRGCSQAFPHGSLENRRQHSKHA